MTINENDNLEDIKEIDRELNKYKQQYKMYIRLSVVKMVKQGSSRGEAAEFFNVHRKTAENWVKIYNNEGISGLVPDYSKCGAECRLTDKQLLELKELVTNTDNTYNISNAQSLIKEKYGVTYTYKQTWVIITEKLGLNYENNKIGL